MTNRRQFLKSTSAAAILLALSGRVAWADRPVMTEKKQSNMSPDDALAALKEGNQRFVNGNMRKRNFLLQAVAAESGQYPFAAVLGCVDSRVAPEIIFDLGIGKIFSARVAGNFANTDMLGSLEFATKLSGAKVIVVLGHSECGAVKGAIDNAKLGNLTQTLSHIKPAVNAVEKVHGKHTSQDDKFVQQVAEENVRLNVKAMTGQSTVISDLVKQGQLKVVGAMYDLVTGKVKFIS